jgi:hypothetical protein
MRKLPSEEGWSFEAFVDGDDIVVENATATWFGGDDDPDDNGETASGVRTAGNPDCMGCALPVVGHHGSTKGSPLAFTPRIPWHTKVIVTVGDKSITVPLIDNGPAKWANDAIDLTQAAFKEFAPLKQGMLKNVSFRVVGGARNLKDV